MFRPYFFAVVLSLLLIHSQSTCVCPFAFGATNLEVLAYSTVTNIGSTTVIGSVGVYPGTFITGFPPGITTPTSSDLHSADAVAQQGQSDALALYLFGIAQACTTSYASGQDIGGLTLTPGVYCF